MKKVVIIIKIIIIIITREYGDLCTLISISIIIIQTEEDINRPSLTQSVSHMYLFLNVYMLTKILNEQII